MGCDIHISIQRQAKNGKWITIPANDAPEHFDWRNYHLFAILADVRNGIGFAGVPTSGAWPSIAPQRGWPDTFKEGGTYMGDHSYTYVTLEELQAFDWDHVTRTLYGIVPAKVFEALDGTGDSPETYSGGIWGGGIVTYEPDVYRARKAAGTLCASPYVRMSWQETAREATGDWAGRCLPWLTTLAKGRPLRLILGFDS